MKKNYRNKRAILLKYLYVNILFLLSIGLCISQDKGKNVGFIIFFNYIQTDENITIKIDNEAVNSEGTKFLEARGSFARLPGEYSIEIEHPLSKKTFKISKEIKEKRSYTLLIYGDKKFNYSGKIQDIDIKVKLIEDIGIIDKLNLAVFSISKKDNINLNIGEHSVSVSKERVKRINNVKPKNLEISHKDKLLGTLPLVSNESGKKKARTGEYWIIIYDKSDTSIGYDVVKNKRRRPWP